MSSVSMQGKTWAGAGEKTKLDQLPLPGTRDRDPGRWRGPCDLP